MKKVIVLIVMVLCLCSCKEQTYTAEKEIIKKIDCEQLKEKVNDGAYLIDVRTKEEYEEKTLDNAINIPLDEIDNIEDIISDKESDVIVFCKSGTRSKSAAEKLKKLGYKNIFDLGTINKCR